MADLPAWLHAELDKLNPEQREAVTADHPRLLAIAPAGSGKTRCLILRTARLMLTCCPGERILAVTFTRAAAKEMVERLRAVILEHDPNYSGTWPEVRTLHSWGASMIRRYPHFFGLDKNFTIYDEKDKEDVIRSCSRDLNMDKWDRSRLPTLWREDRVKALYYERLQQSNAIDYDMIEDYTLKLIAECPDMTRWLGHFRHVLVDEYQDTNLAQVMIVNGLLPDNLFIVGDPRQSIYRFRGAEPKTIVEHATSADFKVVHLVHNYRSVPAVIHAANACVFGDWPDMVASRPVPEHLDDAWRVGAIQHDDEPAMISEAIQALNNVGIAWGDMVVLARNWSALRSIRERMVADEVPHAFLGDDDDPWATNEGRAVARCAPLILNPMDNNLAAFLAEWGQMGAPRFADLRLLRATATRERKSLLNVMADNHPAWEKVRDLWLATWTAEWLTDNSDSGVECIYGALNLLSVLTTYRDRELTTRIETIDRCITHIDTLGGLEPFCEWWLERTTAEKVREHEHLDVVRLMTIHASKGLEFPVVFLVDCRHGVFPSLRKTADDDDRAEDMRVLYVGVTRARDKLIFSYPSVYMEPWQREPKPAAPSPFVLHALRQVDKVFMPWGGA